MRLTPAYLDAIATFYDMFETEPVGRETVYVCTNISCSLNGARRPARGFLARPRTTSASTCARSKASARATIARWRASNGEYPAR